MGLDDHESLRAGELHLTVSSDVWPISIALFIDIDGERSPLHATVASGSVITGGVNTRGSPCVETATCPGPVRYTFVSPPATAPETLPIVLIS